MILIMSRALDKCGFPLAEEQKKQKTFFSHTAGSMGSSVQGGAGRSSVFMVFKVQFVLLPSVIA